MISTRRCAWKDCHEAAKPRGRRGPIPRFCEVHTAARKRQINHHPVKPRSSRPECCRDGVCAQHEQNHAVTAAWKEQDYLARRLADRETSFVLGLLADGYHMDRRSYAGLFTGFTNPDMRTPDPWAEDAHGNLVNPAVREWVGSNPDWTPKASHGDETILFALLGDILGVAFWLGLKFRPLNVRKVPANSGDREV